jgi:adenylyltransferase/sulfurtransferase
MLSDTQIERWSRQILLPDVGGRGQLRLLGARVGVVGDGPAAAQCVDLLRRAGVPVTAGVLDDADVVVDLDADSGTSAALARRAAGTATPLVRARLAGAAGTLDTLVGRPCGCCLPADPPRAAGDGEPLAAPAAQALAALAAAEVVRVLLAAPRQGRRQRFDLAAGDFAGTVLIGAACEVCGARA